MPTTGSCLLEGSPYVSPNDVAVGVRSECIVGVAEVGVGYAVLLGLHEAKTAHLTCRKTGETSCRVSVLGWNDGEMLSLLAGGLA
jgi:hypothetical protein